MISQKRGGIRVQISKIMGKWNAMRGRRWISVNGVKQARNDDVVLDECSVAVTVVVART